jgi:aminoglycoside 6'-N-acetyltransferase
VDRDAARDDLAAGLDVRRLTAADFPLLSRWLAEPGVRRWWNHETSAEAVERDFGPAARGEEPCEDLLVLVGGEPVGLVQRCRLDDYPEDRDQMAAHAEVPPGTVMLDYLVGEPERRGRGLGSAMIRRSAADAWDAYPDAPAVMVAVVAANTASWRALEKAGFRRVGSGDLEPDNPADDPLHHLYRLDRPQGGRSGSSVD